MAGGFFLGTWIDKRLGTYPLFMLVLMVAGMSIGYLVDCSRRDEETRLVVISSLGRLLFSNHIYTVSQREQGEFQVGALCHELIELLDGCGVRVSRMGVQDTARSTAHCPLE